MDLVPEGKVGRCVMADGLCTTPYTEDFVGGHWCQATPGNSLCLGVAGHY